MAGNRSRYGFTLIELLAVTAIISLLSSIVLSQLSVARQKGSDAAKIQALQQTMKALQLYATDNGVYPAGSTNATLVSALTPKYIASIDPMIKYQSLNAANTATCASNCLSYHIGIPLVRTDNIVLSFDKDLNLGAPDFDGTKDNCLSGTASSPDLCYDMTP